MISLAPCLDILNFVAWRSRLQTFVSAAMVERDRWYKFTMAMLAFGISIFEFYAFFLSAWAFKRLLFIRSIVSDVSRSRPPKMKAGGKMLFSVMITCSCYLVA